MVIEVLAGHFVGFGVFNIFRDGLVVLAAGIGLFIEIHGVLLDAFLDAALEKKYSDMFSLER